MTTDLGGSLLPNAEQTFFTDDGIPLDGGTVDFYEVGTTVRKTTWLDATLATPNENPLTLDAAGRAIIWGVGLYRQVVKDSLGNLVWDQVTSAPGGNGGTVPSGPALVVIHSTTYTPGTYIFTPQPGTTMIQVDMIGGGGGGEGVSSPGSGKASVGAGGSGAAWLRSLISSDFAGETLVVGAKGLGGAAGDHDGTDGESSTFLGLVAEGGFGGTGGTMAGTLPITANSIEGGIHSGGDAFQNGGASGAEISTALSAVHSGSGGPAYYSTGGASVTATANASTAGTAATGFGGGGAGAAASGSGAAAAGGNGSAGQIIITEFGYPTSTTSSGGTPTRRVFDTVGTETYTPTSGTAWINVQVQGGGAGGGFADPTTGTQTAAGGNGGAGGYIEAIFTENFDGATLVIGDGGDGSHTTGVAGSVGGVSSFEDTDGNKIRAAGTTGGPWGDNLSTPTITDGGLGGFGEVSDGTVDNALVVNGLDGPLMISLIDGFTFAQPGCAGSRLSQPSSMIGEWTGSIHHNGADPNQYVSTPFPANGSWGLGGQGGVNMGTQASGANGSDGIQGVIIITEYPTASSSSGGSGGGTGVGGSIGAKATVSADGTLLSGTNVFSSVRLSNGHYRITFTVAAPDALYPVGVSVESTGAGEPSYSAKTTASVDVYTYTGVSPDIHNNAFSVVCFW